MKNRPFWISNSSFSAQNIIVKKINISNLQIGNAKIPASDKVRNLGSIFDTEMTFNDHITHISKSSSFQLRNIGHIRKYLNNDATEQLVHAFVTSRLDVGNSLLFGLPDILIKRSTAYKI